MLRTRILVSCVLVPLFVGLCWLDARTGRYAALLLPLAVLLAVQACREMAGLLRLGRMSVIATATGSVALLLTLWGVHALAPEAGPASAASLATFGPVLMAFALAVLFLLFQRMLVFREPGGHTAILCAEVFTIGYVGLLLTMAAELRWTGGGRLGYLALGSLVIGAKVGDIGGYSFGRLFGKRKLSPRLSPGKTQAGAVGAIVTASIATALWLRFAGPLFDRDATIGSWPQLLAIGAVFGIVGLIGDLAESLMKRDAGQKDASHLMPAFGGLLDLIDSILYAAPVALLIWTVWPPVF